MTVPPGKEAVASGSLDGTVRPGDDMRNQHVSSAAAPRLVH